MYKFSKNDGRFGTRTNRRPKCIQLKIIIKSLRCDSIYIDTFWSRSNIWSLELLQICVDIDGKQERKNERKRERERGRGKWISYKLNYIVAWCLSYWCTKIIDYECDQEEFDGQKQHTITTIMDGICLGIDREDLFVGEPSKGTKSLVVYCQLYVFCCLLCAEWTNAWDLYDNTLCNCIFGHLKIFESWLCCFFNIISFFFFLVLKADVIWHVM